MLSVPVLFLLRSLNLHHEAPTNNGMNPTVRKETETMKRLWMSGVAAVFAMSMASVGAQTPQNPPQQTQPPTQNPTQQSSATQEATTTLTGCVYKEADIPGRTPNVAERAGVMEDYILVTAAASAGTAGATGTSGTAGTTPAATAGKAYKLEHAADEKLSTVVGKRVEVTGRVDKGGSATAGTTGAKPDTNPMSPDQIELPEFEVTSIKEVEGTCPTTPTIKK
jgi:hypothetical protein